MAKPKRKPKPCQVRQKERYTRKRRKPSVPNL